MAKYDPEFNQYARRVVKNVNQKIRRAEARGEKDLPTVQSLRELKAQFSTKNDLKKELQQLELMLNNKEALQRKATKDGTISNWRFEYIVKNLRSTDKWITREIERQKEILKDYPDHLYAIRAKLNKLEDEKEIIHRDLNKLTAQQLRTVGSVVDRYKRRNLKTIAGRKYFMRNLDDLLTAKGLPRKEREVMQKKLNAMTNEEFEEFYNRHDVVSNIMTTFDSPEDGDENKARFKRAEQAIKDQQIQEQLTEFQENVDDYILEAKRSVKKDNLLWDATNQRWVDYETYQKMILGGEF